MSKSFKEWYFEKNEMIPDIDPSGQSLKDTCDDIMRETMNMIASAFEDYEEYKKTEKETEK